MAPFGSYRLIGSVATWPIVSFEPNPEAPVAQMETILPTFAGLDTELTVPSWLIAAAPAPFLKIPGMFPVCGNVTCAMVFGGLSTLGLNAGVISSRKPVA